MGFEPMTSSILVHLSLQFKYMIFYIFTCIEIVFFLVGRNVRELGTLSRNMDTS